MVKAFHLHIIGRQLDIPRSRLKFISDASIPRPITIVMSIDYDNPPSGCVAMKMLVYVLGP
jgi:hypothetical protein